MGLSDLSGCNSPPLPMHLHFGSNAMQLAVQGQMASQWADMLARDPRVAPYVGIEMCTHAAWLLTFQEGGCTVLNHLELCVSFVLSNKVGQQQASTTPKSRSSSSCMCASTTYIQASGLCLVPLYVFSAPSPPAATLCIMQATNHPQLRDASSQCRPQTAAAQCQLSCCMHVATITCREFSKVQIACITFQ
jgi:hypothetical protein